MNYLQLLTIYLFQHPMTDLKVFLLFFSFIKYLLTSIIDNVGRRLLILVCLSMTLHHKFFYQLFTLQMGSTFLAFQLTIRSVLIIFNVFAFGFDPSAFADTSVVSICYFFLLLPLSLPFGINVKHNEIWTS